MKSLEGMAMPMAALTLAMLTPPAVFAVLGTTDGMPRADEECRT